ATRLVINGQDLGGEPRLILPVEGMTHSIADGSNAGRLVLDVTVPADAPAGFFPLRVQTESGLSNAVAVAVDDLPQRTANGVSAEQPAKLPAAFSGRLNGPEQARVWFHGQAGQRLVADVEAHRLGANFDPILEVKTERGTPLAIEWGKPYLHGDARAELTLPADGLYFVELHDLAFKAPGQNPFRIKIGDLKLVDLLFPTSVPAGESVTVAPVGTGWDEPPTLNVTASDAPAVTALLPRTPSEYPASGPLPALDVAAMRAVRENNSADEPIDARFAERKHVPLVIQGRIARANETDAFLLDVTPGQELRFSLEARAISSSLDGELIIDVDDRPVKRGESRPGAANTPLALDPLVTWTPPENVERVRVRVRDRHGRGGTHYLYRLTVAPAGRPDFDVTLLTPAVTLPAGGTAVARLQVERRGYNGPLTLSVVGAPHIRVRPEQVPAGKGRQDVFVTLQRESGGGEAFVAV
ncbi:MAG: hypothetical protein ACREIV_09300, partial [Planctomycetaceae bacterium]